VKPLTGCPVISPNNVNNLVSVSQAIPFQIRTISKIRLTKKIGSITDQELQSIKQGLEIFLKH
jgi:mRNA-degrading endonuclease toxin of MazEF toxin-antitoxin module